MASPKLYVSVSADSSSTGSVPIRAPLTPDNDDSSDNESGGYRTDSSDSRISVTDVENGSEFDNVETASKMPLSGDPLQETVEMSDDNDKDYIFRPIVAKPDEESSVKSGTDEDENEVSGELDSVERVMLMPVAQLSLDDDELDSLVSEEVLSEEEDGKISATMNVVHSLQTVDSALRVKVLFDDDDSEFFEAEDSVLGSDNVVANYSVPVAFVEDEGRVVSASEENAEIREDIRRLVNDFVSAKLVRNEELNLKASNGESLVGKKEADLEKDSGLVEDVTEERMLLEDMKLKKVEVIARDGDFAKLASEQHDFDGATGFLNDSNQSEKVPESEELARKTGREPVTEHGSIVHEESITFESMDNVSRDSGRVAATSFALSDEDIEDLIWGQHEKANHAVNEMEQMSFSSYLLDSEGSPDQQILVESYDKAYDDTDEERGKTLDSAFEMATKAEWDERNVTVTSSSGSTSRVFSLERLAGSGSSFRAVRPSSSLDASKDFAKRELSEEETKKVEKIQNLLLKFLILVHGLGHYPEDSLVAQVLQRLVFVTGGHVNLESILASAKMTLQHDCKTKDELDFSLNILVIGKSGVGKSATINSIFANNRAHVDAFEPATTKVKEIVGTVDGVRVRILDTPGLKFSAKEEATNRKILSSIKKLTKKFSPDVVLYVDRLDTHSTDFSDLQLLSLVSEYLSTSIWQSAIIALTHAASPPPDGPLGSPLKFEVLVAQRSLAVQQAINRAVGDIRLMHPSMMHPVALIENHPVYQKKETAENILPNGQNWRSQLLLLCYSLKILSEANLVYKARDTSNAMKLLGYHFRALPLSHLVSSLLQTWPHRKLGPHQGGDDIETDVELMDLSDDQDEDDYDELPPFKPLRKSQVDRLTKEQRKAYYEEYDYRVKLFQKKQLKEEVKRLKEMKKQDKNGKDKDGEFIEDVDKEDGGPAMVPVALPDFVLPPSFDSDNPSYRYRVLEPTSELTVRPVLDTQGWDHDCGYDGVSIESNVAINGRFPGGLSVQMTKDKEEFKIHLDSSVCTKHGENMSTMTGLDIQSVGRQLVYIFRHETEFRNFRVNKTTGGISITLQGKDVATGLKIEDQAACGKHLVLSGSAGAVTSSGETAFGANIEMRVKGKDFPIDEDQSTLGLSLIKYRRELGVMANLQSQFTVGRSSKMGISIGMNSKRKGQISVKMNSSELQIALLGLLPIVMTIFRSFYPTK